MIIRTIGELKEAIKDMKDDMPIIAYKSNMETSGYKEGMFFDTGKFSKELKDGYDSFDNIDYQYEVYEKNENGSDCVNIS